LLEAKPLQGSMPLTMEFTSVPPYGGFGQLKGIVRRVDTEKFRVAVYIRVHGGWWTKPTWNSPTVPLAADGSFAVDITTGGQDEQATDIAAFLLPAEYYPPGLRGEAGLPAELAQKALGRVDVTRSG